MEMNVKMKKIIFIILITVALNGVHSEDRIVKLDEYEAYIQTNDTPLLKHPNYKGDGESSCLGIQIGAKFIFIGELTRHLFIITYKKKYISMDESGYKYFYDGKFTGNPYQDYCG
jgi:hypothetical protein